MRAIKDSILLIVVDEAHVNLSSQWGKGDMREDMNIAPSYLRAQVQSTTKAPTLAMTASAKMTGRHSEIEEIKEMCSLQYSQTVVILMSPILQNHLYVNIKKPPSSCGFYGQNCYSMTPQKLGSVHVLWRIYLKHFIFSDINQGKVPKRAILFVKRMEDLIEVDDFLTSHLGHLDMVRDKKRCPWVINYSDIGPVTAHDIRERTVEENSYLYLYITTSVMLFGLNIKDVSIIIMMSPFNNLNSILQAGGRGGRRQGSGERKKCVIYTLYNGTDLRKNSSVEDSVRYFCYERQCLKQKMSSYFVKGDIKAMSLSWCCSSCGYP